MLAAAGALGYAWLSGGLGRLFSRGEDEVKDILEGLPPRVHDDVPRGVLHTYLPDDKVGTHEGWYGSFTVEQWRSEEAPQAGTLSASSTTFFVGGKAVHLVGDPTALYYFGRSVANVSSLPAVHLARHPFSPGGAGGLPVLPITTKDAYRLGYGFAFTSGQEGRRVVNRMMTLNAVAWSYGGQSHFKQPGSEMSSWLDLSAALTYEVAPSRLQDWL